MWRENCDENDPGETEAGGALVIVPGGESEAADPLGPLLKVLHNCFSKLGLPT